MLLLLTAALLQQRVNAHLLIGDTRSAYEEVIQSKERCLDAELQVFARLGKQREMLLTWEEIKKNELDPFKRVDLLETMAWGVIDKGFSDSSPLIRAISLIAAKTSSSSHGVTLLLCGMEDPSLLVRMIATRLAKEMRDKRLQERVVEKLQNEANPDVRLAAIEAVGGMRAKEALPLLVKILESSSSTAEEKAAAAISFAELADEPDRTKLLTLCQSKREGLRLMACQLVIAFSLEEETDLLLPLLSDHSQTVRSAALQAIAFCGKKGLPKEAEKLLADRQYRVRNLTAWLAMINGKKEGAELLYKAAFSDEQQEALFATGALVSASRHSTKELKGLIKESSDPLVRMNAALGLLYQRESVSEASSALATALKSYAGRLMWREEGAIRFAAPSDVRHKGEIPQYPDVVNQLVRLELYQLLSTLEYPGVEEAFREFLKERTLETTGIVVALMLTEGGSGSLDIVRPLMQDPDPKIRAQAALILALWGREEEVIRELETIYLKGDRQTKEKVLEGIGSIGSKRSLPFLVECLKESKQHLRMIAASSIIECLYH